MSTVGLGAEVAERVLAELTAVSRKPFQRQLARLLGCAPGEASIREFASKHPDRWAQAVAIFAPLAGIQRDAPVQVNIWNVKDLSDAALLARAAELGVPLPVDMLPAGVPQLSPPAELGPEPAGDIPEREHGAVETTAAGANIPEREQAPRDAALPEGEGADGS